MKREKFIMDEPAAWGKHYLPSSDSDLVSLLEEGVKEEFNQENSGQGAKGKRNCF